MLQDGIYASAQRGVTDFRNRVLPLLFAGYLLNFIDRTNISYAQLQMGSDIGISLAAYGLGAGLFFVGYASSCIPANLALKRVGVRLWMALIFIAWGLVSCLMASAQGEKSFYVFRLLLGVIEGGFVPAVNYYIASWIPPQFRSRINAIFIMAIPVGMIVGGPLAAALLGLDMGMPGWRWLFLLEGLPTVVLGLVVLRYLPASPEEAAWLSDEQRSALRSLAQSGNAVSQAGSEGMASGFAVFGKPVLWGLLAILLIAYAATFALIYFLPTILKDQYHITPMQIGMLLTIPNIVAFVFTYLTGRSSEYMGDIRWHLAAICLVGSVGFFILGTTASASLTFFIAVVSVITTFTIAYYGPLNTAIQNVIGAQAAPLALVTTIGSLGGFFGPTLTGRVMQMAGGDWRFAAQVFGVVTLLAVLLAIACVRNQKAGRVTRVSPEMG